MHPVPHYKPPGRVQKQTGRTCFLGWDLQPRAIMLFGGGRRGGWMFLLLLSLAADWLTPGSSLVIEEPIPRALYHVPAAFGPDVAEVTPPLVSRPLIGTVPRDACVLPSNRRDIGVKGAIALVERGGCNFTQKVQNAQQAGASAVVVTDSNISEVAFDEWAITMSGSDEGTAGITIPSVFVSGKDGESLWAYSDGHAAWHGAGSGQGGGITVTLNSTGRVPPHGRGSMGPLETLGVYLIVSFLLVTVSGLVGLIVAVSITCYRRSYRSWAMKKLAVFKFRREESSVTVTGSSRKDHRGNVQGFRNPRDGRARERGHVSIANTGKGAGVSDLIRPSEQKDGHSEHCSTSSESAHTHEAGTVDGSNGDKLVVNEQRGMVKKTKEEMASGKDKACSKGKTVAGDGDGVQASTAAVAVEAFLDRGHDMCAICLDSYEEGEALTALPCSHAYHTACIRPWLTARSGLCPMCKKEAFPPKGSGFCLGG
ncbi:unnamed protein product, partial [Choristocarpus tenellus]